MMDTRIKTTDATSTEATSQPEQPTVVLPENIPSEHTFVLKGKFNGYEGEWHLALTDDASYLYANSSTCYVIPRDEAWDRLFGFMGNITIKVAGQSEMFQIVKRVDAEIFKKWKGPPSLRHLESSSTGPFVFIIICGLIKIMQAMSVAAEPSIGSSAQNLNYFELAMGCLFIGYGSFRQLCKPKRYMFLIDAMLYLIFAISIFLDIANGSSPWWGLLAASILLGCQGQLRDFFRFKILRGENHCYEPLERNTAKAEANVSDATTGNQFRENFKKLSS